MSKFFRHLRIGEEQNSALHEVSLRANNLTHSFKALLYLPSGSVINIVIPSISSHILKRAIKQNL